MLLLNWTPVHVSRSERFPWPDGAIVWFLGETGLGKSTLMDTLFNTKFEGEPTQHNQPGVQLKPSTYELQESNVRLKLTIVNTVGFGDQINKEDRWGWIWIANENIWEWLKTFSLSIFTHAHTNVVLEKKKKKEDTE